MFICVLIQRLATSPYTSRVNGVQIPNVTARVPVGSYLMGDQLFHTGILVTHQAAEKVTDLFKIDI